MITKVRTGSSTASDLADLGPSGPSGPPTADRDGLEQRFAALRPAQDDAVADALRAALRRRLVDPPAT